MLLCNLEGLIDTFTNSNARHHDNKLAPTIMFIELEHGFDVGISFSDTGFHLDGKIIFPLKLR